MRKYVTFGHLKNSLLVSIITQPALRKGLHVLENFYRICKLKLLDSQDNGVLCSLQKCISRPGLPSELIWELSLALVFWISCFLHHFFFFFHNILFCLSSSPSSLLSQFQILPTPEYFAATDLGQFCFGPP